MFEKAWITRLNGYRRWRKLLSHCLLKSEHIVTGRRCKSNLEGSLTKIAHQALQLSLQRRFRLSRLFGTEKSLHHICTPPSKFIDAHPRNHLSNHFSVLGLFRCDSISVRFQLVMRRPENNFSNNKYNRCIAHF